MSKQSFPYWTAIGESELLKFSELPHLMAQAMHPSSAETLAYAAARINLDAELSEAVRSGELVVRNAAGLGKHTFPFGDALQRAVLMPADLRPYLAKRGIELRLTPHGSGPTLWTLINAANAIAEQEGWTNEARASLQDQMVEAATKRELIVRHPHTDLPINTGPVRDSYELVTPADVNAWLKKQGASYLWNIVPSKELHQSDMSNPLKNAEESLGWWNSTMDASVWWNAESITPVHAAMLLSRFNPNKQTAEYADSCSSDEMEPEDFRRLKNIFDGASKDKPRTLEAWHEYAEARGLRIHSWVREWKQANSVVLALKASSAAVPTVRSVSKGQILAAFDELVTAINLSKAMADGMLWTKRTRVSKGTRGGVHSSQWNPVLMAVELYERKLATKASLNRAFSSHSFLATWRDEWIEHSNQF